MALNFIKGISEITNKFDYYIIDLWGVLHDGHDPYKGAVSALKNLKAAGKKIVLLSNAPRRASIAREKLQELGFDETMYDLLITSGEVTYEFIKTAKNLGNKYYYIGPEKDRYLLQGLNFEEVAKAKEADFALATGFEGFGSSFDEKQHQLDECLQAGLHLFVANPDKIVVKQTGEEQICAGLMGIYYMEHGGKITYFGKPHDNAYKKCLDFFGLGKEHHEKILCIGDSLHTDIAGANVLGAGSLLVAGGIHKRDFYVNGKIVEAKLLEHFEKDQGTPDYIIEEFAW